jgi:formylglycine-generating enzyme required for sulfatase activity
VAYVACHDDGLARPQHATAGAGGARRSYVSVAAAVPVDTSGGGACPDDMVLVDGQLCTQLEETCVAKRKSWQCAEFAEPTVCTGAEVPMRFCIDRYEYPNEAGALPVVMQSFYDAQKTCKSIGKRVCKSMEWTLACEGPSRLPFPYGYIRSARACSIDKKSPMQDENKLYWPATQAAELARLDQREPSGARQLCRSDYGVFDLTGSVDEWTVNESGWPYKGALKGGNWGEYRNACRPATLGHDEGFHYYQTGFRCCKDAEP